MNSDRTLRAVSLMMAISLAMLVLVACAPVLTVVSQPLMSGLLYLLFAPLCHQLPERSFFFLGFPLAVCQRCFGIYLGLFLGSFLHIFNAPRFLPRITSRTWIILGLLPLLLDVGATAARVASNTPATRFLTGLIFGTMLSAIPLPSLAHLLRDNPWRSSPLDGHDGHRLVNEVNPGDPLNES